VLRILIVINGNEEKQIGLEIYQYFQNRRLTPFVTSTDSPNFDSIHESLLERINVELQNTDVVIPVTVGDFPPSSIAFDVVNRSYDLGLPIIPFTQNGSSLPAILSNEQAITFTQINDLILRELELNIWRRLYFINKIQFRKTSEVENDG